MSTSSNCVPQHRTRFERLLLAHDVQYEAAALLTRSRKAAQQAARLERFRTDACDLAAHRCEGCGGWLYSVRRCITPGCT